MAGIAFAGVRGIQRVEISTNGGQSWADAELKPPLSPLTWTLWTYTWSSPPTGQHTLQVRATDGGGHLQSADGRPSYPDGSSGYHGIRVNVGG